MGFGVIDPVAPGWPASRKKLIEVRGGDQDVGSALILATATAKASPRPRAREFRLWATGRWSSQESLIAVGNIEHAQIAQGLTAVAPENLGNILGHSQI